MTSSGDSFSRQWLPFLCSPISHLHKPCYGIRKSHLARSSAAHSEQLRARNHQGNAPCPARCDVQPVEAVQELHPARRLIQRARRHRVDRDRGLLPLELIHRTNAKVWKDFAQLPDLSVIRCDEEYIILGQRPRLSLFICVGRG